MFFDRHCINFDYFCYLHGGISFNHLVFLLVCSRQVLVALLVSNFPFPTSFHSRLSLGLGAFERKFHLHILILSFLRMPEFKQKAGLLLINQLINQSIN